MPQHNPLSYLGEHIRNWWGAGTYHRLRELESSCGPISQFDGKEVINLASNSYLGFADHPMPVEATLAATRNYR